MQATAELTHGAATVISIAQHFDRLKDRAVDLIEKIDAEERGFFTPTEDEQTRHLLISYWQSRNALFELVSSFHQVKRFKSDQQPLALMVAYAGALVLVDVARFNRENFHHRHIVRAKLNEPEPHFGIPRGTYDHVQKSLTSPVNAWHLYHALTFFLKNQDELRTASADNAELRQVMEIVELLQDRLDVSPEAFALARTRVRARELRTSIGLNLLGRALYGLQKSVSSLMANRYVKTGHKPGLPPDIDAQLEKELRPGDIIVVRKEHAFTNYFLPGYWPHAALYIGTAPELRNMGLHEHKDVESNWHTIETVDPSRAGRVLEAMKDGVRIRSVSCPFSSDALVIIRPQLQPRDVAEAIGRGFFHAGKEYDFDFDFARSDRLVCTEVVYRSYEGIGDISFDLTRRAGRLTLAAEDLLQKAVNTEGLMTHAVYCPAISRDVLFGDDGDEVLQKTIGRKSVSETESNQ
ncbi:MAG: YiiX/YebB-like N1pC/P60 family cysteine hydrolase [Fuerstiella sp.]|nr:YiiX/YebB-like N1pC/P60 family cysteine hydrolase [Fuerstiella sp.]